MARIDYHGIKQNIKDVLEANIPDVDTVYVEEDLQVSAEMSPWMCVYLTGREVPEDQPIAAGKRTRMRVNFSVWVWVFNLELDRAERDRDRLVGEIELALMNNRSLNESVEGVLLDGGELPSNRDPDSPGFFSGGEVRILVDVTSIVE
jgi:hypothetical protein